MWSRILLLIVALQGVLSDPVCQRDECNSVDQVREPCLDFCIREWKRTAGNGDNDTVCTLCRDMVEGARTALKTGGDILESGMVRVCTMIPFAESQQKCYNFAMMEFSKLKKILESDLDPEAICGAVKLCSSERLDNLLSIYQRNGPTCQKCIRFTEGVRHRINRMGIQEFATKAVQTCRDMGPYTDACATVAFENVEPLFTAVPLLLGDATSCVQSARCSEPQDASGFRLTSPPAAGETSLAQPETESELCDYCEQLVQSGRDWLLENRTEEEFKDFLEKVCSETGILDERCKDLVDGYYTVVFEWINHNLKPGKLCTMIGLCTKGFRESFRDDVSVWPILLSGVPVSQEEPSGPLKVIAATRLQEAMPVDEKDMLQAIRAPLPESEPLIGKDNLERYGQDQMQHPAPGKEDMGPLVEQIPDGVIRVSIGNNDEIAPSILPRGSSGGPSVVAKKDPFAIVIGSLLPEQSHAPITSFSDDVCVVCQNVLHYAQTTLMDQQTEAEIKNAVEGACEKLPKQYQQTCEDFVSQYGDLAITLLAQEIDPSRVCPLLRLCPSVGAEALPFPTVNILLPSFNKQTKPLVPQKKEALKDDCVLCVYAVEELVRILEDQKTEDEIKLTLDKVCSLMIGPDLVKRCRSMVDTYTQEIIDTLLIGMTPEEICTYIKACHPKAQPLEFPIRLPVVPSPVIPNHIVQKVPAQTPKKTTKKESTSPACILCEFVMKQVDQTIGQKATQEEIEAALRKVCTELPSSITADCQGFVNEYFNMLVEFLTQMPPSEVCRALKVCLAKNVLKPTLDRCELCDMVVLFLDRALQDPGVEFDITKLVQKVCVLVPGGDENQDKCRALLHEEGPYLLYLLSTQADKDVICHLLKQCPAKSKAWKKKNKALCKKGPEYFCQSRETAIKCKKERYCKKHYWLPTRQVFFLDDD